MKKVSLFIMSVLLIVAGFYFLAGPVGDIARVVGGFVGIKKVEKLTSFPVLQISSIDDEAPQIIAPVAITNLKASAVFDESLDEQKVFSRINKERKEKGLTTLNRSGLLDVVANLRVNDMFSNQYISHINVEGVGPGDIATETGYEYLLLGEHIAVGERFDEEDLIVAWRNSVAHKSNLFHEYYRDIGLAVETGKLRGEERQVLVAVFGVPEGVCAPPSKNFQMEVLQKNNKLLLLWEDIRSKRNVLLQMQPETRRDLPFYNNQIRGLNELIEDYNRLFQEVEQEVEVYNERVRQYNKCVRLLDSL